MVTGQRRRRQQLFDFTNDGLVILVMEGSVHFLDVGFWNAFLKQECPHFVSSVWENVVGAER